MSVSISEVSDYSCSLSIRDKSADIGDGDITDIHQHLGGHHKVSVKNN